MNPIGINLWNFINTLADDCTGLPEKLCKMGFSAIEIPMTHTELSKDFVNEVKNSGLPVSLCAALGAGYDISSFDESVREATKKYLRECLATGAKLNAEVFAGPLYTGGGKRHFLSEDEQKKEWDLAVNGLKEIAAEANSFGIKLALEPLHRYRTSVVNTATQALQMVADIGMSNVGVHFDTFHATIEEANLFEAMELLLKSKKMFHFHACENNREVPSLGAINWKEVCNSLIENGYEGHVTMEAFAYGGFDSGFIRSDRTRDEIALIGLQCLKRALSRNF